MGFALSNGPTRASSSLYSFHVKTEADTAYRPLLLFWPDSDKAELKVKVTASKKGYVHVFFFLSSTTL